MKIINKIILISLCIIMIFIILPINNVDAKDEDVIKILLVGNSYTYYNDYGGMLTEYAKKKGKKIIVVAAVYGGKDATYLYNNDLEVYWWDGREAETKINYLTGKKVEGHTGIMKLSDVVKNDFGDIGRANEWDYVILQNHQKDGNADGNLLIYDIVKDTIPNKKNFIIIRTYSPNNMSHSSNVMIDSARENGFSLIDIRTLANQYDSEYYLERLTIKDGSFHPSKQGAYLIATACYSRIFGKEGLAISENVTNFIELYDNQDGTSFYKPAFKRSGNAQDYKVENEDPEETAKIAMQITETTAKKIQSVVYNNYDSCIKIFDTEEKEEDLIDFGKYEKEVRKNDENESQILKKINPNTKFKEFIDNLKNIKKYKILRNEVEMYSNDNEKNENIIATGDVLSLEDSSYIIIVTGDINKDGKSTLTDLAKLRRYLVGYKEIDENGKIAADMNFDSEVTLTDVVKMREKLVE